MKSHPITLVLILIGMVAIAFGYANFARATDLADVKETLERQTEALTNSLDDQKKALEAQNKVQTCRWLSDKIDNNENAIRLLERDDADDQWIIEKRRTVEKLKDLYTTNHCTSTVL